MNPLYVLTQYGQFLLCTHSLSSQFGKKPCSSAMSKLILCCPSHQRSGYIRSRWDNSMTQTFSTPLPILSYMGDHWITAVHIYCLRAFIPLTAIDLSIRLVGFFIIGYPNA